MKKHQASIALTLALLPIYWAVAADEIPGYAIEMNAKRIDGLLFRYTRFNSESPFPCLRLELIKPKNNWEIVDKKDICDMNGKRLGVEYSYSGFDAIEFKNNAIQFKFNYFSKDEPGEYTQHCSIQAIQNKIQNIECTNPDLVE